jgi:hypothetical protein
LTTCGADLLASSWALTFCSPAVSASICFCCTSYHRGKGSEHEKPNKGHAALKILAEHIAQRLKEREFCVVFEGDLERCWQSSGMSQAERERKIQDFAESQGWTAAILETGATRAIFQKAEPSIDAASI